MVLKAKREGYLVLSLTPSSIFLPAPFNCQTWTEVSWQGSLTITAWGELSCFTERRKTAESEFEGKQAQAGHILKRREHYKMIQNGPPNKRRWIYIFISMFSDCYKNLPQTGQTRLTLFYPYNFFKNISPLLCLEDPFSPSNPRIYEFLILNIVKTLFKFSLKFPKFFFSPLFFSIPIILSISVSRHKELSHVC